MWVRVFKSCTAGFLNLCWNLCMEVLAGCSIYCLQVSVEWRQEESRFNVLLHHFTINEHPGHHKACGQSWKLAWTQPTWQSGFLWEESLNIWSWPQEQGPGAPGRAPCGPHGDTGGSGSSSRLDAIRMCRMFSSVILCGCNRRSDAVAWSDIPASPHPALTGR